MTDTTIDLGNQLTTIKEAADLDRIAFHEAYRAVARVLKPLRFEAFHPKYPYIYVDRPLDSREETLKWLARFD